MRNHTEVMGSPQLAKITVSNSTISSMVARVAEIKTKWLVTNIPEVTVNPMTWVTKLMAPNFNTMAKIMAATSNTVEVIKIMLVGSMALINTATKVEEHPVVACISSSINLVDP